MVTVTPGSGARAQISAPQIPEKLSELDEHDFEQLLLKQAHRPARNPDVWRVLISADVIERTRTVLAAMQARNRRAINRRTRELSEREAECHSNGKGGHAQLVDAKADYHRWRLGADNFDHTVTQALAEVNAVLLTDRRQSSSREQLATAIAAIREHREATAAAQIEPEPHDVQLWSTADTLDSRIPQKAKNADAHR